MEHTNEYALRCYFKYNVEYNFTSIMYKVLALLQKTQNYIYLIACASGTFGDQCSSNCHCVKQPCNPMNGTCPNGGCQRGYKDDKCITGTYHGLIIVS